MDMTLGQRIQKGRMGLTLSQEGLGERLGVSRQAVSKWEADAAVPDTDKLIALSKLFGLSLNELLQVEPPDGAEETGAAAPRQGKLLWKLLSGVLAFCVALLWVRVGRLESQIEQLESRGAGLDPAAALVGGFDYTIQNDRLYMDLLPKQLPDGLEVTFTLTSPGQEGHSIPGEKQEGDHYTAVIPVGGMDSPFTISAVLSDGEGRYTQALVRILSHVSNSWSWESLWEK